MGVLLLIYMWMCRPKSDLLLYVAAFLFGLGLTNHQTLLFLGLALAVAVLMKDAGQFRDFAIAAALIGVVFIVAAKGYALFASEAQQTAPGFDSNLWKWSQGPTTVPFWIYNVLFLAIPIGLAFALPHGKTVCATILLAELGVAFYMYLPFASEQNPPMNWGYPRTWEGFMHAVTRGQYEAIVPTDIFSDKFIQQLGAYLSDLRGQFSLPVAVLGFLPFCSWGLELGGKRRSAFPLALGLVLASVALIVLETLGWTGARCRSYRLLIAPVLLLAGWGFFTLLALFLRKQIADLRGYPLGTKLIIWAFLAAVLVGVLYVDVMSLKALFKGELSAAGKAFFAGAVFGPPLAIAAAWALGASRLKLDADLGTSQQRWLIVSVVGFISVSVIFLIFQNPQLDIQNLFIGRVQFIQSHAFYALWLGYGILLSVAWLERMLGRWALAPARRGPAAAGHPPVAERLRRRAAAHRRRRGAERPPLRLAVRQLGARRHSGHPGRLRLLVPERRGFRSRVGRPDQRAGHGRARLSAAHDAQRRLLRRHRSGPVRADLHDLFGRRPLRRLSHHPERAGRQHVHEHHPRPLRRHDLHPVARGQQRGVPQVRRRRQRRPHPGWGRHQDRKRQGQACRASAAS
jgi:hypothetical protein